MKNNWTMYTTISKREPDTKFFQFGWGKGILIRIVIGRFVFGIISINIEDVMSMLRSVMHDEEE